MVEGKMMKKLMTILLSFLMLILCSCRNVRSSAETSGYISASWSRSYANIEELSINSDLIALVKVKGIDKRLVQNGIPFTTFQVEVITPVYNVEIGDAFVVFMTGGVKNGITVEVEDDPLLQVGEECMVFCKENPDGTFQILSGPQGRFAHQNGKLNSLSVVNERVREKSLISKIITIKDMDVLDMIDQVQTCLKNNAVS
jgi:hypothetical protein